MDKPGNAKALVELNKKLKAQATIIREERARASALIASIGEGLIATNEVGKIIQVNQAALDILDYKRKDLIDSWMPQQIIAVHEDDSPIKSIDRPIMKVFLTGKAVTEILYYRRSDGTKIPVYITASPIFLRGRPIGAIEIFRDITKDIEADKLKSEFISLASHQLRTPLSSINIYSHMLKEEYAGRLSRSQVKLLDVVLSATSRMNSLINTLLNITRVEGNNISIESKPTDIAGLLDEIVMSFKPRYLSKSIDLKLKIEKSIPLVLTDRVIIGEVFNNLISNAIKYTPEDESIIVSLQQKNSHILFTVKDTGYGIPTASQQFIFTKFFRANNIIAHDVTGTGLGLYFTRVLADKINSEVWFKSSEGKGTSFFFSIPISGNIAQDGKFKLEYASQ